MKLTSPQQEYEEQLEYNQGTIPLTSIHASIRIRLKEYSDAEFPPEKSQVDQLEVLGLSQQVTRNINAFDIICIGWNICNSWAGVAGTLALTIALGGTVTPIYGAALCFVAIGCSGLTMAELVSVYPTAGGQYSSLCFVKLPVSLISNLDIIGLLFLPRRRLREL